MGCATGTIKCILNLINTLILIGAVAILAFAIFYIKSLPTLYISYLFFTGIVGLLISILGCFGICKESVVLTKAYAIILLVSLIGQALGKFIVSDVETGKIQAKNGVEEQWAKEIEHSGSMDALQLLYKCCGKDSADDYQNILHRTIPKTCYSKFDTSNAVLYVKGCLTGAEDFITTAYTNAAAGEWSNLILTLIMFIFACYLVMRFTKKQQRYNYN